MPFPTNEKELCFADTLLCRSTFPFDAQRIVQRLKETGRPASTGTPTRATSPVVTPPTSSERSYVERRMESDLASRTSKLFPLPPREVCLPLLELFFTHIHPHVPILHKPSFMHKFEEIIVNRTDEAFVSLLFVVMALGCRFSDDPIVYTDFGLLNDGVEGPSPHQKYAAGYALAVSLCCNRSAFDLLKMSRGSSW